MRKKRATLIAAGILLVLLVGGYIGAKAYRRAKFDRLTASVESIDLAKLKSDDLVLIEVPTSGLTLRKTGGVWETVPGTSVRLDQSEITSVTWSLSNMRAEKIIDPEPADLGAYGLDKPRSRVIVTTSDGARVEYIAGNMTPSRSGYYAMMTGDPKVYLVPSYPGERLYLKLADVRDKNLPTFEPGEVRHVILTAGKTRIEIEPKEERDLWISSFTTHVLTSPYKTRRGVAPDRFNSLLTFFKDLRVRDFIDDSPTDLARYGLDKPARVFIQTGTSSLHLLVGKAPEGSANRLYAKLDGEPGVFTIDDVTPALQAQPFDLTDKFALIVGIDRIESLEVKIGARTFSGRVERRKETVSSRDEKGKEVTEEKVRETYVFNGKKAAESSFKNFYQACIGLVTDAELPGAPPKATPEIRIRYRLTEPAGTETELDLLPFNRDFYAASREGAAEFLVSRVQAAKIEDTAEKMEFID